MLRTAAVVLLLGALAATQTVVVEGPERSPSEKVALAYIRTVLNAQKQYKKKKGKYATSLAALVNHGSFTRRLARSDRGDYTVSFRGKPESFSLLLTPKEFAPERRAFYADHSGKIRVEEGQPAGAGSVPLDP